MVASDIRQYQLAPGCPFSSPAQKVSVVFSLLSDGGRRKGRVGQLGLLGEVWSEPSVMWGAVDILVTLSYLAWYQALFFKMSVP